MAAACVFSMMAIGAIMGCHWEHSESRDDENSKSLSRMHGLGDMPSEYHPRDTTLSDELLGIELRMETRIDRLSERVVDIERGACRVERVSLGSDAAERILSRLWCQINAGTCIDWRSYGGEALPRCAKRAPRNCGELHPVTAEEIEAARIIAERQGRGE